MKLTRADRRWLEAYRRRLASRYPGLILEILIYGSKARGESGADSDLDVLVVVQDRAKNQKRALRDIGYELDPYGDVLPSILVYTQGEWEARRRSGSPFRKAVDRDGVSVL